MFLQTHFVFWSGFELDSKIIKISCLRICSCKPNLIKSQNSIIFFREKLFMNNTSSLILNVHFMEPKRDDLGSTFLQRVSFVSAWVTNHKKKNDSTGKTSSKKHCLFFYLRTKNWEHYIFFLPLRSVQDPRPMFSHRHKPRILEENTRDSFSRCRNREYICLKISIEILLGFVVWK